ncbi:thioesterase domain-containing protein [Streptomyces sp. NBC_01390]|uniref:thioesterase II family protein n=1 Tax=Streptomyces sp. NBC_01390 TaxID=2903850 RepID=UPI003248939E
MNTGSQVTTGASVVRLAPCPRARLRVVCFPHSGAGPGVFHRWARSLAPDVEVWSAVLPGRAARADEPFADRWESVVADAADAIEASVPGPYALLGQSLGAALAFETARELQRRRRPPAHLIVSASAAPDAREVFPVPADDEALIRAVDRHYAGIPAEVRAVPELVAYFLPVLRADLELALAYTYRSGPPLGLPVTAFAGDRDSSVSAAGLAAWRGHTVAGCEIHRLAGGHFCLDDDENRALAVVRRRLAGAR